MAVLLVQLGRQVRPGLLVQVEQGQLGRRVKLFSADPLARLAQPEDLAVQLAPPALQAHPAQELEVRRVLEPLGLPGPLDQQELLERLAA